MKTSTSKRLGPLSNAKHRPLISIILLCTLGATLYGLALDLITAWISPAYFNLDHPSLDVPAIFHSSSLIVLGLSWGLVASVPLGLGLGIWLGLSAQYGPWPPVNVRSVRWLIISILLAMGLAAMVAGEWSYRHALMQGKSAAVAGELCALRAHQVSYAVGVVAVVMTCGVILIRRHQSRRQPAHKRRDRTT